MGPASMACASWPSGPRFDLYRRGRRRDIAAARLRLRGPRPPASATGSLRRRPHGVVPLFLRPRRGRGAAVHRFRLVVDWHEVWTTAYWREYLGRSAGASGTCAGALHARAPACVLLLTAACRAAARTGQWRRFGARGRVRRRAGTGPPQPAAPVVVFAGRHIPEKRVPDLVPAIALAREAIPGLTAIVFGDGPDREETLRRVRALALEDVVTLPGFVSDESVTAGIRFCALPRAPVTARGLWARGRGGRRARGSQCRRG